MSDDCQIAENSLDAEVFMEKRYFELWFLKVWNMERKDS